MLQYSNTKLFIGGSWQEASDGRTLAIRNPATGFVIGQVACASRDDVENALAFAETGFQIWRNTPPIDRANFMRQAAKLLRERVEYIATGLTLEQGKPLIESKGEVIAAAGIIEWFADESLRVYGRQIPSRTHNVIQLAKRFPVGPVAAFTPWNFPINQIVRKLCAALAAGCSMIIKGPEETPFAPAELIRSFNDAGVPKGVIALIFGNPNEISQHLIPSPIIRKITFTGSTAVGKKLAALAGANMKRCTMELGGHAPFIVAEDANVDLAIGNAVISKFRNAGQVCTSPTRFLVHKSHYQEFTSRFAQAAKAIQVGDGLAPDTQMGPLANRRRLDAMAQLTQEAIEQGATLLAGGKGIESGGNYWLPTVLAGVPIESRVFNEEPFGPIASIISFETIHEAILEANRLPYGLAAYAYTSSLSNANVLSENVEAGMLWINQTANAWPELPFGGIKDSGYGSEGGPEAIEAYLYTSLLAMSV